MRGPAASAHPRPSPRRLGQVQPAVDVVVVPAGDATLRLARPRPRGQRPDPLLPLRDPGPPGARADLRSTRRADPESPGDQPGRRRPAGPGQRPRRPRGRPRAGHRGLPRHREPGGARGGDLPPGPRARQAGARPHDPRGAPAAHRPAPGEGRASRDRDRPARVLHRRGGDHAQPEAGPRPRPCAGVTARGPDRRLAGGPLSRCSVPARPGGHRGVHRGLRRRRAQRRRLPDHRGARRASPPRSTTSSSPPRSWKGSAPPSAMP